MRSAILVLAALTSCVAPDHSLVESQSVWQIFTATGRASAVPVAVEEGMLIFVTAAHVGTPDGSWTLKDRHGDVLEPVVHIEVHPTEDVRLIAVPVPANPPTLVPLAQDDPSFGDTVYGAGWGGGWYLWLTKGIVSSPNHATTQTAAGDSGGALLDPSGRLVGVLVGRLAEYDAHMGAFVPVSAVREILEKSPAQ